jgi:hypothetical protein
VRDRCDICGAPLRLVIIRTFEDVSVPDRAERDAEVERFEAATGAEREALRQDMIGPPRSVVQSGNEADGRYRVTCSAAGDAHGTVLAGTWRPEDSCLQK